MRFRALALNRSSTRTLLNPWEIVSCKSRSHETTSQGSERALNVENQFKAKVWSPHL